MEHTKTWLKSSSSKRSALLALLFLELIAAIWFWHNESQHFAAKAFLTKLNGKYVLAWKDESDEINVIERTTLEDILRFSKEELGLKLGRNLGPEANLENVWKSSRLGGFVVHWKSEADSTLNQMTFYSDLEADFFMKAFRSGSYSRSILGHSILLVSALAP